MKKQTFKFDVDKWFRNKDLRGCSATARGLWVDVLALCSSNDGYLCRNGQPIDDKMLSRMVGESVTTVKKLLGELGKAGIYDVDEDGRLYVNSMVSIKTRKQKEKKVVAKTDSKTKIKDQPNQQNIISMLDPSLILKESIKARQEIGNVALAKRVIEWWKTPSGWAKKGQEQAVPYTKGVDIDEFKYRVAERLGEGPWVDVLTPQYKKQLLAEIEKHKPQADEKPSKAFGNQ